MSHIVRGHRWDMPIPFKVGSALSDVVKERIYRAIGIIESQTSVRFRYRSDEGDYILFRKAPDGQTWSSSSELGDESSFLGIGGGRQEINLTSDAPFSTVIHEICHAVGLAHEHQRRDRDTHVTVRWDHIDDDHYDAYSKKPSNETRHWGPYDQNSIMHYDGSEFSKYTWSSGWTRLAFHRVGSTSLLLALKERNGRIHVDRMDYGVVGPTIQTKDWSSGYTQLVPFSTVTASGARSHFVFFLKRNNGIGGIYRLNSSGIQEKVDSIDWTPNWTSVAFYEDNAQTFLVLLKQHTGRIDICRMNSDGSVGAVAFLDNWSSGWTQVRPFSVRQANGQRKTFLFLLKKSTGLVHICEMNSNGTVGALVANYNWSSGWTSVAFVEELSRTSLLMLKESNGRIHVHQMNSDGTVGARTDTRDWSAGYTTMATHVPPVGTPYVLFHKKNSGDAYIHYFSGGAISGAIKPPTLLPSNGAAMGEAGRADADMLTPGDISGLNRLAGV